MDMFDLPLWVLLLFFPLMIFIITTTTRSSGRCTMNLPPGPPGLPVIGNIHQLGTLPHRSLAKLSTKYGPVFHFKLFSIPTVVVSSPETAKQVLKTHDLDCCTRPSSTSAMKLFYNYKDISFAPYGDYWREMRKISVSKLFSVKKVQSCSYIRQEELHLLLHSISESALTGSPVNLSEKFFNLLANVTTRISFGTNFEGSGTGSKRFDIIFSEFAQLLLTFSASDFFPRIGWIVDRLTGLSNRFETTFTDLDAFLEKMIEDRLQNKKMKGEREDVMDVLLKMEQDQVRVGSQQLTRDHVKAILLELLIGGVETVATTLTWAMTELARHPRVLAKLQFEIRNHIGVKENLSEGDVDKLQYLTMVVKETFRMHPPGPLLVPREAMASFQVDGYNIYPKTRIFVNVWAMGRDPNLWKDPEEFMPERFMGNSTDIIGTNYELLPFGSGRRTCPGQYMAMIMCEYTLASILYHFDWELPYGMDTEDISVEESPGLAVHKKTNLELVPIKHQWTT